jgi:hypothetical protein
MLTFVIYGLICGTLLIMSVFRPAVAISAILCTYGLEQWAQSKQEFFFTHGTLTNYVTCAVLVIALVSKFFRGEPILRGYPAVGRVTLALFGFTLLSILWSIYREGSIDQWVIQWPYIFTVIILSPLLVTSADDLRVGFMSTLALGSVLLLLLMVQTQWEGRQIVLSRGVMIGTVISKYGNPLAVATLAGYVALIALLLNFSGLARFWQLTRWGIIALGLAASIRSGSRGQLFGLLIAATVFLPMSRRITNIRGFIATVISVALMLVAAQWAFDSFSEARRWQSQNMLEAYESGRIGQSLIVLEYWISRPAYWLIGLGTSACFDPRIIGFYPHVVFVEVLAEEGLIGFALLWMVVILTFRSLARLFRVLRDDRQQRGLLAATGALFLFEVILSFKQGSLLGNPHAFAFAIMLGQYEQALTRQQQLAYTQDTGDPAGTAPFEEHLYSTY